MNGTQKSRTNSCDAEYNISNWHQISSGFVLFEATWKGNISNGSLYIPDQPIPASSDCHSGQFSQRRVYSYLNIVMNLLMRFFLPVIWPSFLRSLNTNTLSLRNSIDSKKTNGENNTAESCVFDNHRLHNPSNFLEFCPFFVLWSKHYMQSFKFSSLFFQNSQKFYHCDVNQRTWYVCTYATWMQEAISRPSFTLSKRQSTMKLLLSVTRGPCRKIIDLTSVEVIDVWKFLSDYKHRKIRGKQTSHFFSQFM